MGTRLPDVTDYGQRPSLRSGRVDEAYFEGVEVADAVSQATTKLASMYGEKREKDSRLEYALAKSELTKLDIQEREKLKDRDDWDAFDQDYQRGFATGSDAIFKKYGKLSAEDRALLGAEADVIRERGRVYAGEMARTKETDWNRAEVNRTLTEFAEQVNLKQDSPLEQQQLMLDSLELVKAAEERGYFTEQEAEELMHSFVASTATNSLDYMEPEARLEAINASLAAREADGPITPEEIAAGGGSGSIGDFLPAHTLKKMQRETEKEIEIEDTLGRAYEANDEAWRLYPGLDQDAERRAHIKKLLPDPKKDGAARKEAESLNRMARNDEVAAEGQVRARTVDELSAALRQYPDAQLSPKKLATLTDTEVEHLKRLQRQLREDQEWADATIWDAREAWDNLTPEQKANTDFDGTFTDSNGNQIPWKTAVHADRAEYMSNDRKDARNTVATKAAKGEDVKGVITPLREVEGWLVNTPLFDEKPTSASDEEDQQRWARMIDNYNAAVYRRGGIKELSEAERKALFTEIMVNHVYIDEFGPDAYIPGIAVLPEEREDIYLPLSQSATFLGKVVNPKVTKIQFPEPFGTEQTPEEWITNQYYSATNSQRYPDEKEMQHIWALFVAEGVFSAYNRILDLTEDMRGGKPQGLNPSGP